MNQNKVNGIWFGGDAAYWALGLMSGLAKGKLTYGLAVSNQNTFCPSLTKVWKEYFIGQWTYSTKAIVKCLSGDQKLLIKA